MFHLPATHNHHRFVSRYDSKMNSPIMRSVSSFVCSFGLMRWIQARGGCGVRRAIWNFWCYWLFSILNPYWFLVCVALNNSNQRELGSEVEAGWMPGSSQEEIFGDKWWLDEWSIDPWKFFESSKKNLKSIEKAVIKLHKSSENPENRLKIFIKALKAQKLKREEALKILRKI